MSRRGSAILAVLFLMVIGIIIASSVLVSADAAGAASASATTRTQSRALAWSGVQALMSELAVQREELLDGRAPEVTPEWDLYTLDDGTRGVVRMIGPDPQSVAVITPENAKLDVNTSTAEMLARVPGLDSVLAGKIVAARGSTPFTSIGQLLDVDGITPELLYGGSGQGDDGSLPTLGDQAPAPGQAEHGGLGRYLTVFSFDPNVQAGVGQGAAFRGKLRVNLHQEWSEELGRAITDRFGEDAANTVKSLMNSGREFASDADLVRVFVQFSVAPEEWAEILDVFTTSDDQFLRGRVDLNTASAEVLACVPGISADQASAIVNARDGVEPDLRGSATWPVLEGILTPEDFVEAVNWLTTRSMQWRVRLEAGVEHGDPTGFDESAPMTLDQLLGSEGEVDEGALEHRVVLEAVIDASSSRARVAYLRDITLLEPTLSMRAARVAREQAAAPPGVGAGLGGAVEEGQTPAASDGLDPLDEDPLDLGGDLDMGFDDTDAGATPADEAAGGPADGAGGAGASPGGQSQNPPEMVDRRIGRWTTHKAGDS